MDLRRKCTLPFSLGVSRNVRALSDYVFIVWREESQEVIIIEEWAARDLAQTYLRLLTAMGCRQFLPLSVVQLKASQKISLP